MTVLRYVVLDANNVVINTTLAEDPAFAAMMGWIQSDTATFGDIWNGTSFTTPPPPPPTLEDFDGMLNGFLSVKELQRKVALRNQILNSTNPPINTMQGFVTALENWNWD